MESDGSAHSTLKYGPLFFGLTLIVGATLLCLFAGMDPIDSLIYGLIGVVFILLFFLFKDKFVRVELRNQTIRIKKGTEEIEVSWLEVESLTHLNFISPPLYKLRLRNYGDYFLFATSRSSHLNIAGFTKDFSEMGKFISKKKKEFGF